MTTTTPGTETSGSINGLLEGFLVAQTCTRLAWYTDRRQWGDLVELFTDEVDLDYTSLAGGEPATVARADVVNSWRELLGSMRATHHLVGSALPDVEGDRAECVAPFQAMHVSTMPHGQDQWLLGGHYRFSLARTTSGWRISGVTMTVDWSSGNQRVLG